jgi:hypothetical protein
MIDLVVLSWHLLSNGELPPPPPAPLLPALALEAPPP